jgi:hypothetical protein
MKLPLAVLCLLLTIGCNRQTNSPVQAAQPTPAPPQWEYQIVAVREFYTPGPKTPTRTMSESKLNELGAQGWELTGVDTIANPVVSGTREVFYYLKRRKP